MPSSGVRLSVCLSRNETRKTSSKYFHHRVTVPTSALSWRQVACFFRLCFLSVGFSYVVLWFGLFSYFTKWLASGTVSKWCLCRGVSLHKDQLLQDPLTFKQNCFGFFSFLFSFFFTVLFVHPHHPVTTVLTHYSRNSPMAWYRPTWWAKLNAASLRFCL